MLFFTIKYKVCLPHGVFFCPMGFFFLKGFTVVFDSKKLFFRIFFFRKKKHFFESKTTVNPLRKKKPMGKKKPHGANRPYCQS